MTTQNNAGSISVSVTGGGLTWKNIGISQSLENNFGYICGSGNALSLSLPSSADVGDVIEVCLNGSTSWTVTQGAGQRIHIGNTQTTSGIGGSLASTAQGDCIKLVCDTSGTHWIVTSNIGIITVI